MAGGVGTVGTVWVGVAPAAAGFQKALQAQLRSQLGPNGRLDRQMQKWGATSGQSYAKGTGKGVTQSGKAGQKHAKSFQDGYRKQQVAKPILYGPGQRAERATRRNMTRAGRRSGQSFAQGMGSSMKSTGRSLTFTASGAAALGLGVAAAVSANFESSLSSALAVAEPEKLGESYAARFSTATGKAFRDTAFEVGKDTIFSNKEAAQGLETLVRGGLDAETAYKSLMATANLAAAGQMEFADAANIAVSAFNTFDDIKKSGITTAGNEIAIAANKSQATVETLGLTLQYAGSFAAEAGQSFQDTLTAATLLGKKGIVGSKAGTRMLNFYEGLRGKSEKAKTSIKDLGLSFRDQNGEMKDFVGIAKELKAGFKDVEGQERADALAAIFGIRGRPLANTILKTSLADIKKIYGEIGNANDEALKNLAHAQLGPVARAFELMKGEWETLISRIGKAFEPSTMGIITWLENLAMKMNLFSEKHPEEFAEAVGKWVKRLAVLALIGPGFWLGGSALRALVALHGKLLAVAGAATKAWAGLQLLASPAITRGLGGLTGRGNLIPGLFTPGKGLTGAGLKGAMSQPIYSNVPLFPAQPNGKQRRQIKRYAKYSVKLAQHEAAVAAGKSPKNMPIFQPLGTGTRAKNAITAPLRSAAGWFAKLAPFTRWKGWVNASTGLARIIKLGLTATGVGALIAGAFEGVWEAVSRSGEKDGGGFIGNLKQTWDNITDAVGSAQQAFDGVGESLSGLAEATGLDALFGTLQDFLSGGIEGFGWLLEFFTSSLPEAIATAADVIFSLTNGIQRSLINMRIWMAQLTNNREALKEARADEAALDTAQDEHEKARALRDQATAQREVNSANEDAVDAIVGQTAAYKETKKALDDAGLLEFAIKVGKFHLKGDPRREAEILLGEELAGEPLKATVPIAITVDDQTGTGSALTFKGGSAPWLREIITGGKGDRKTQYIQFVTEADWGNLSPEQQSLFASAMLPNKEEGYVRIKVETVTDPDAPVDIGGKPVGDLLLTPKLDPDAEIPKIKLPKTDLPVDPVIEDGGVPEIPASAIPLEYPAHPVLTETGMAGGLVPPGLTTTWEGPAVNIPAVFKLLDVPLPFGPDSPFAGAGGGPIEVPLKPAWAEGSLPGFVDQLFGGAGGAITVGPELTRGVELAMAEAKTQINTLAEDQEVKVQVIADTESANTKLEAVEKHVKGIKRGGDLTVPVTSPGAPAVVNKLRAINRLTAVPFAVTVKVSASAALNSIPAKLAIIQLLLVALNGTRAKLSVTLVDKATQLTKDIQKAIDGIKQGAPPIVSVSAATAIAALSTVRALLSAIDGTVAKASIQITTTKSTIVNAPVAGGGDGEEGFVASGYSTPTSTFGATPVAAPRAASTGGTTGGATGGVTASSPTAFTTTATSSRAANNPITGSYGRGFKRMRLNYRKLLKQLKKAQRKLRGAGVKEINKTTKAFDKALKKFERVREPKKLGKDPTKAQKKRHKKETRLWKKQVKTLDRRNERLKKSADKRKDTLTGIEGDTKQYLSMSTRSFKFASRGTSEQVLAGVKDLEDTFTLAGVPAKQQVFLRKITANSRAALKTLAKDLERFESARELRDKIEEGIKGTVDWSQFVNTDDLTRALNRTTAYMAEYQNNLKLLRARGVDKEVVEKLSGGDPERARLLAKNLANATDGEIAALNTAFDQFTKQAAATGDTAAGAAFGEIGKGAMSGFAAGMAAEEKRLRGKIQKITNRIVNTVRKTLGIKSPSTVFAEIGRDMMRGLVVGLVMESEQVRKAVVEATSSGIPTLPSGSGVNAGAAAGAAAGTTVNVYPSTGMNEAELASLVVKEMSWATN